jgi:hypothetical protein
MPRRGTGGGISLHQEFHGVVTLSTTKQGRHAAFPTNGVPTGPVAPAGIGMKWLPFSTGPQDAGAAPRAYGPSISALICL